MRFMARYTREEGAIRGMLLFDHTVGLPVRDVHLRAARHTLPQDAVLIEVVPNDRVTLPLEHPAGEPAPQVIPDPSPLDPEALAAGRLEPLREEGAP